MNKRYWTIALAVACLVVLAITLYYTKFIAKQHQISTKTGSEKRLRMGRVLFPNALIEDRIYQIMRELEIKIPKDYMQFLNLEIHMNDNIETLNLKVHVTDPSMKGFTVKETIHGFKIKRDHNLGTVELIEWKKGVGAIDTGALIPEKSDVIYNCFSRERDWDLQKLFCCRNAFDVDVSWSEEPYKYPKENPMSSDSANAYGQNK